MSVLIVAEHREGEVNPVVRELVTAARGLGGLVEVAVIAADPAPLAAQLGIDGVDALIAVAAGAARTSCSCRTRRRRSAGPRPSPPRAARASRAT